MTISINVQSNNIYEHIDNKPRGVNPVPRKDLINKRLAGIFNEWAKRYSERPEEFSEILDNEGKPISDYGESCAVYFQQIAKEMDEAGTLPVS